MYTKHTDNTQSVGSLAYKVGVTKLSMTRWTNSVLIFPSSYSGMSRRPVNLLSLLPQLLSAWRPAAGRGRLGSSGAWTGSWKRKACLCPAALSVLEDEVDQKIFGSAPTH